MWSDLVKRVLEWWSDWWPTNTFQGAITKSLLKTLTVAPDVEGASEVWFPKDASDVATAIAKNRRRKTIIRSGTQAAASDVVDAAGGIVINLAAIKKITVTGDVLKAEAAATVGTIAKQLADHRLALPLIDNRQKTIASNLMDDGPSCLIRTLGLLSEYVAEINAVSPDGKPVTLSGATAVAELKKSSAVLTDVTFKPTSAENLWMIRESFPYPGKENFAAVLKALFLTSTIPPHCDIVLDAASSRHDFPLIRITATGISASPNQAVVDLVQKAIATLPAEFAREVIAEPPVHDNVIRLIVDAGHVVPIDLQVETHRTHSTFKSENESADLDRVIHDIDLGLSFGVNRTGKLHKDLRLFTRIQRNRDDCLEVSGLVYTQRTVAKRHLAPLAPLASMVPVIRVERLLTPSIDRVLKSDSRIPDFQGEIFIPSDLLFEFHANQYATSSFPIDQMTPFMLAYPLNEADIQAAIRFARVHQKSIVARSGGHQYCGLSSGGNGTIVLSMDAFSQFNDIEVNTVDAGPAVPLTRLAAMFKERGITIPHGECPLVCIGGHLQTGGFGHLARSFGLALDYVKAITIVLADGSVRTLQRPNGPPVSDDDQLFWGVLGGNAGSFGIITNYRIECIQDIEHPNSFGFTAIRKYNSQRYKTLMQVAQAWTKGIVEGTLAPDIDFMMTVESSSEPFLPAFHLVELVQSNSQGANNGSQMLQTIIDASDADAGIWSLFTNQGPETLSSLSDSFVRRFPKTTLGGREFKFPYKKRVNSTMAPLTDEFIDNLVQMVDKVVATDGVYLVFQMLIGGGSFQNSNQRPVTSIPGRDCLFNFVFDVFYDSDFDGAEDTAELLQKEMQQIVNSDFSGSQEHRLFWGSFGDVNMTDTSVRDMYYDDLTRYQRLQQLKKKVDPDDVFHSPLTVKLP